MLPGHIVDGLAASRSGYWVDSGKLVEQQLEKFALVARFQLAELFEQVSCAFAHTNKLSRRLRLASSLRILRPGKLLLDDTALPR